MSLTLVTAPGAEVVTLEDMRDHLRVVAQGSPETHPEDDMIDLYRQAAIGMVDGKDGFLGRALVTQTWALTLAAFPAGRVLKLPLPPLRSVTSIVYRDGDDASQTFAAANYYVDTAATPGLVQLTPSASWPQTYDRPDAVTVTFDAGYGAAKTDVPELIRWYIQVQAAAMFRDREPTVIGASVAMLPHVQHALERYRVRGF